MTADLEARNCYACRRDIDSDFIEWESDDGESYIVCVSCGEWLEAICSNIEGWIMQMQIDGVDCSFSIEFGSDEAKQPDSILDEIF